MWGNRPTARTDRVRIAATLMLLAACGAEEPPTSVAAPSAEPRAEASGAPPAPAARAAPATPAAPARPRVFDAVVTRAYPHDTGAFTQGLFVADGTLYESTGQRGESALRRLDIETGEVVEQVSLPARVFGEGSTAVGDRIVVLSWRAGEGYVHDLETLARTETFPLAGEGWGVAFDEASDRLIVSDGTSTLRFLDPESFAQTGAIRVTLGGRPVGRLNELEWLPADAVPAASGEAAGPRLLANVWQQDFIVRIDPETGIVDGVIDVSRLFPASERVDVTDDVPNGIAYDRAAGRLFVTGKRWPELFEITLRERE